MTCVSRVRNQNKNEAGAMITAKNAVFIGLQLENCCLVVGGLSFGGGVY